MGGAVSTQIWDDLINEDFERQMATYRARKEPPSEKQAKVSPPAKFSTLELALRPTTEDSLRAIAKQDSLCAIAKLPEDGSDLVGSSVEELFTRILRIRGLLRANMLQYDKQVEMVIHSEDEEKKDTEESPSEDEEKKDIEESHDSVEMVIHSKDEEKKVTEESHDSVLSKNEEKKVTEESHDSVLSKHEEKKVTEESHDSVLLPPALSNFCTIKDFREMKPLYANVVTAQSDFEASDGTDDMALRKAVAELLEMLPECIQTCASAPESLPEFAHVVDTGNKFLEGVYTQVWDTITMTENKAFEEYTTVVKDITTASPPLPRQPVSVSALALYHHAAAAMEEFREVTEAFVTTVRESFPNVGFNLAPLKSLGRICEKSVLKHRGGVDKIYDILRAMLKCANLGALVFALHVLVDQKRLQHGCRVKDRFSQPSAGGWRDCMINLVLPKSRHVVEIQFVHDRMFTAHKGLPGHAVYGRMRNAKELIVAGGYL